MFRPLLTVAAMALFASAALTGCSSTNATSTSCSEGCACAKCEAKDAADGATLACCEDGTCAACVAKDAMAE